MFVIAGIFDRLFKKKKEPWPEDGQVAMEPMQQYPAVDDYGELQDQPPEYFNEPTELKMESKIYYDFGTLEYRLKLHNISIDVLGDITVKLKSQRNSIVAPLDSDKVIEMLEPGKDLVLKFKLKPQYKTGKSSIFGTVEYFDFKSKERKLVRLRPASVDFQLKKIIGKRITDDQWRTACGGLKSYEIETDLIEIQPDKLFSVFKRTLESVGLFMLPPIENVNLYRGIAKFFGTIKEGSIIVVETQVIGDKKNSKVLFRIWSSDAKDALTLAFRTLDTIEEIIKIKKFIVET